jgi:hypothetical protein
VKPGSRVTRLLDDADDDPLAAAVNLVDVFLILVVALLAAVSVRERATEAREMESVAPTSVQLSPDAKSLRDPSTGNQGARAGVAYRLPDGRLVYVPDESAISAPAPRP